MLASALTDNPNLSRLDGYLRPPTPFGISWYRDRSIVAPTQAGRNRVDAARVRNSAHIFPLGSKCSFDRVISHAALATARTVQMGGPVESLPGAPREEVVHSLVPQQAAE